MQIIGAAKWEHGERSLPEFEKIVEEKRCYLQKFYFSKSISKLVKNAIYLLNFHHKVSKFLNRFRFFPKTLKKVTQGFKIFEKYDKVMHFTIFANFRKFSSSHVAPPPDPILADPLKCSSESKSWWRRCN